MTIDEILRNINIGNLKEGDISLADVIGDEGVRLIKSQLIELLCEDLKSCNGEIGKILIEFETKISKLENTKSALIKQDKCMKALEEGVKDVEHSICEYIKGRINASRS